MKKKRNLSAKAIRILRKVQEHILQEPKRYDQNDVLTHFTDSDLEARKEWGQDNKNIPKCGSIGCIGGWVNVLTKQPVKHWDSLDVAAVTLGLDYEQRGRLFASVDPEPDEGETDGWPLDLQRAYCKAKTQVGRARVGARRIERFIQTDGAE